MGVPTFYRWLCTKYPKVTKDAVEELEVLCGSDFVPADLNDKNPNGFEFDNLYVDMNGVVHPCCHPEDSDAPNDETEMFKNVMDYLDRIVAIVRPRKIIYLALDGVAPRAKMNQQRSRRFKAALQADIADDVYNSLKSDFEAEGRNILPQIPHWDSNVITPGTPFMDRLAQVIRYYIHQRLTTNSYWKNLAVLFSDSNIPGEGEHKIMQYVRSQRTMPNYNPNTVHCIHGMDADLIMLSLATHEPHFYIIREIVTDNNTQAVSCANCLRPGHLASTCRQPLRPGVVVVEPVAAPESPPRPTNFKQSWKPLQFLQIPVLREYLQAEFNFQPQELLIQDAAGHVTRVPSDLERHIDDFVFMCFLVGNDFLPHLPSLSIHKGSIDQMLALYKCVYPQLGQYLTTTEGKLNLDSVLSFIDFIGKVEPEVLKYDYDRRQRMKRNGVFRSNSQPPPTTNPLSEELTVVPVRISRNTAEDETSLSTLSEEEASIEKPVITLAKPPSASQADIDKWRDELRKRLISRTEVSDPQDPVALGSDEPQMYRRRYYTVKFHLIDPEDTDIDSYASNVATHFVRGLQWVLQYYYQSTPSWEWYFPFHHSPLTVDLHKHGFNDRQLLCKDFEIGEPLTPLEQLMANLPPRSSTFLPMGLAELMANPKSPLIDFYPTKFEQDQDGKKYDWQWVALLPFIDPHRLKKYARKLFPSLTEEESRRNSTSVDLLCVAKSHQLSSILETRPPSSSWPGLGGKLASSNLSSTISVDCDGFLPTEAKWSVAGFLQKHVIIHQPFLLPGTKLPQIGLNDADRQLNDSETGNKFNNKVAKRMILQIVGGIHYERFREKVNRKPDKFISLQERLHYESTRNHFQAVRAREDFAADYVGYGHSVNATQKPVSQPQQNHYGPLRAASHDVRSSRGRHNQPNYGAPYATAPHFGHNPGYTAPFMSRGSAATGHAASYRTPFMSRETIPPPPPRSSGRQEPPSLYDMLNTPAAAADLGYPVQRNGISRGNHTGERRPHGNRGREPWNNDQRRGFSYNNARFRLTPQSDQTTQK